jgi:hypothetical protein
MVRVCIARQFLRLKVLFKTKSQNIYIKKNVDFFFSFPNCNFLKTHFQIIIIFFENGVRFLIMEMGCVFKNLLF